MQFPWQWDGGTISTNLDVIWGMSVKARKERIMVRTLMPSLYGVAVIFFAAVLNISQPAFGAGTQTFSTQSYTCEKKVGDKFGVCKCEGIIDCENMKKEVCGSWHCGTFDCECVWVQNRDKLSIKPAIPQSPLKVAPLAPSKLSLPSAPATKLAPLAPSKPSLRTAPLAPSAPSKIIE